MERTVSPDFTLCVLCFSCAIKLLNENENNNTIKIIPFNSLILLYLFASRLLLSVFNKPNFNGAYYWLYFSANSTALSA